MVLMSYPDDELDSRAPGPRDTAADEAARIEDQTASTNNAPPITTTDDGPDHQLAVKLANLSRLTELINVTGSAFAVASTAIAGAANAANLLAEELKKPESERDHG
jgi:hypothetical protein